MEPTAEARAEVMSSGWLVVRGALEAADKDGGAVVALLAVAGSAFVAGDSLRLAS